MQHEGGPGWRGDEVKGARLSLEPPVLDSYKNTGGLKQ